MPGQSRSLSPRELEILRLLAGGKSEKRIAEDLVLSLNTVKTHVKSIYAKAGVHNKDDAVDWYRRNITQNG
jgi:LuxR family maltose regulon positive regulatory protein